MTLVRGFINDLLKQLVRPFKRVGNTVLSINPVIGFTYAVFLGVLEMLGLDSKIVVVALIGLIFAIIADNLSARSYHIKKYGSLEKSRELQKWTSSEERRRTKIKLLDYFVFYTVLSILINSGNVIADVKLIETFTVSQLQEILRVLTLAGITTIELGSIKENIKFGKSKEDKRKLDEIEQTAMLLYNKLKSKVEDPNDKKEDDK